MWYVHLEFRQASVTLKFVNAYINLVINLSKLA